MFWAPTAFHLRPDEIVPATSPIITVSAVTDALPVALADVREFVGLPSADTSRDAELTAFIKVAAAAVEDYCQLALLTTTFVAAVPYFTDRTPLLRRPFQSVTSVEYVKATDGEITTAATTLYHAVVSTQAMAIVYRGKDQAWPTDVAERHDAVRITFVAGYGLTSASVPPDIQHAIKMTVASLDSQRGDNCGASTTATTVYAMKNSSPSVIPAAAQTLLHKYQYRYVAVA